MRFRLERRHRSRRYSHGPSLNVTFLGDPRTPPRPDDASESHGSSLDAAHKGVSNARESLHEPRTQLGSRATLHSP